MRPAPLHRLWCGERGNSTTCAEFGRCCDAGSGFSTTWRVLARSAGRTLDRTSFFADHGGDTNEERYAALAGAVGSEYDRELSHRRRTAYREAIAGGREVAEHKPDPAVYLLALLRLGIGADHAMAVEDTPHGVAAAQRAGLRCVAIPNPFVDPARMRVADLVLASAGDLSWQECWQRCGRP